MIFWGPPGTGKTTLAHLLAAQAGLDFFTLSAVSAGVREVREVIGKAESRGHAVLFIDEIHRFSKSQQDSLLGAVERGTVTLIGATTENPSFEVIRPLLSRCQVYVLESLGRDDLMEIVNRALQEDDWLRTRHVTVSEEEALLLLSGGDARKLLNLLELAVMSATGDEVLVTDDLVKSVAQRHLAAYDKGGEQHYDIISAFIKSMRGSDPNAAVYWLARMIEGGEDPKFIARRMVILASEDIGNANPNALVLAMNCFRAVEVIGYPECRIILSQTAVYLACSPKSNASYVAIEDALALARKQGSLPVPLHLRNAPTRLMKELGYGKDYAYAHAYEGGFASQEYLPEPLSGTKLYEPGQNAREEDLRKFLKKNWKDKYGY
jgi:putative ATPase